MQNEETLFCGLQDTGTFYELMTISAGSNCKHFSWQVTSYKLQTYSEICQLLFTGCKYNSQVTFDESQIILYEVHLLDHSLTGKNIYTRNFLLSLSLALFPETSHNYRSCYTR